MNIEGNYVRGISVSTSEVTLPQMVSHSGLLRTTQLTACDNMNPLPFPLFQSISRPINHWPSLNQRYIKLFCLLHPVVEVVTKVNIANIMHKKFSFVLLQWIS